jgi:Roadblock/LC7 domain
MSPQTRAVENWTLQPLMDFVREASARLVLVLTPSGQVLAQSGFSRAVDVMSAAALAAAIVASTSELARQMQQPPFAGLSHQGLKHGFFLATFNSDRGVLAILAVYDLDVSSLGLVQLFYEQLASDLKAASPKQTVPKQVLAADFERELTDSLNTLFGR